VVEPCDFGAAPQVVALLQALGVLGLEEKLDGEADGVLRPDRLPHPRRDPGGHPDRPAAERRVERLGQVQVVRGTHAVGEPGRRGRGARPQDQVVVGELVISAQVERVGVGAAYYEAE
jgi:hypothetical protein